MSVRQKYLDRLAGDHILVIGGSSGIGYGVAEACIEEKCIVYISASSPSSASRALDKLHSAYPSATDRIHAFSCDLGTEATLEDNITNLFNEVTKNGKQKLDHVVYTAGDAPAVSKLENLNLDTIKQAGMIRFFAPLLIGKQLLHHSNKDSKSSYTITSGTVSQRPMPDWTVIGSYAAGQHAIARGLALDLRPVRVNTIVPGVVDTEMWKMSSEAKSAFMKGAAKHTATGRVGYVDDIVFSFLGVLKDRNVSGSLVETNGGSLLL